MRGGARAEAKGSFKAPSQIVHSLAKDAHTTEITCTGKLYEQLGHMSMNGTRTRLRSEIF